MSRQTAARCAIPRYHLNSEHISESERNLEEDHRVINSIEFVRDPPSYANDILSKMIEVSLSGGADTSHIVKEVNQL